MSKKKSVRVAPPNDQDILDSRGELSQNLIDIAARDLDRTAEDEAALIRARAEKPESFYSDLLYSLANIRYPEDEARLVWVNLLTHKAEMSTLLGRNVGIRVAALDFFRNVLGALGDVKIVGHSEYVETAKLALTDGLTGVYNHRFFQERLSRLIDQADREHAQISLLMVDIDNFKKYNDGNGHVAGDICLREVSFAMRAALGPEDFLARYGGEEFAAVLWRQNKAQALESAERVRATVEALPIGNESQLPGGRLTISIGVATFPDDAPDRGSLIDWADLSLYLAKTGGKNRAISCPVDRRRAERESSNLQATLRITGEDDPGRKVIVVDFGHGGLAMAGENMPAAGTRVDIQLEGENFGPDVVVRGRVNWRRAESRLGELAGVQFVGVPARIVNRVLEWIASRRTG